MNGIALVAPDDRDCDAIAEALARVTARAVELLIVPAGLAPVARARNQGLERAHAPFIAFLDEPPRGSFWDAAARLLDGDEGAAFVTGWGEAVPSRLDPEPRPATLKALVGRSWFAQVPALWRRQACLAAGGFDATLPAGEALDLALRLLDGSRGFVVETPELRWTAWGAPASDLDRQEAARLLFERHRPRLEAALADVVVQKERTVRELVDRVLELKRRLAALDE